MKLKICKDKFLLGEAAAEQASTALQNALRASGRARILAATGAAQFEFLDALTSKQDIDWKRVAMFHLDEYLGIPDTHPASFSKFLQDRLIGKVGIKEAYLLAGNEDPAAVIRRVDEALRSAPIDVAFVGIGENGHLAFNDPPADFETEESFLVVNLDERQTDTESEGDYLHCSRRAKSGGGSSLPRRRDKSFGSGLDPANASQYDGLPGHPFCGPVEFQPRGIRS